MSSSLVRPVSDREVRVRSVMALVAAGEWKRGESFRKVVSEWGVSDLTARQIVAEAHRRCAAEQEPERLRYIATDALETVLEGALQGIESPPEIVTPKGLVGESPNVSRKVAIEAAKALLAVAGADMLPAGWDALSTEERWAEVDKAQQKLDAVRASLPPRP